jgi:hypothetical protein
MTSDLLLDKFNDTALDGFTDPVQRVLQELPASVLPNNGWILWAAPQKRTRSRYYNYRIGPIHGRNAHADPYDPSPFFALEYMPYGERPSRLRNGWVEATNFICVEHTARYNRRHEETHGDYLHVTGDCTEP